MMINFNFRCTKLLMTILIMALLNHCCFTFRLQLYQFSVLYITCLRDMHYCGPGSNMKKMKKDLPSRKYNHIYVLPACLKFAPWLFEVYSVVA